MVGCVLSEQSICVKGNGSELDKIEYLFIGKDILS